MRKLKMTRRGGKPIHGMCVRIGLKLRLYEMIQAKAGKTLSAGELTEVLTQRLEKKAFEGPSSKGDTLRASIEERQDLLGKRMNLCSTSN